MRKRIYKIIKEGKKVHGVFFDLYFKGSDDYKIGFIFSGKIGKSTKRNYVKRVIREYWRKNLKGGDFLFVLRHEVVNNKSKEEIKKELQKMVEIAKCEKF